MTESAPHAERAWPSPVAAWYTVGVLSLALLVNFLDRGIINLLIEPIKADLGISDTQMSLITGLAFVTFYMFLGMPIARLVDMGSRRLVLGVGLTIWSLATSLCGAAGSFAQLFGARVAVGVGEACTGPATYSLLADTFPPAKLPRAIAVLNFGLMAGQGLALIIGGTVIYFLGQTLEVSLPLIGAVAPWQAVFIVIGLPGLLVAALIVTLPEPARRGLAGIAAPSVGGVVKFLAGEWRVYGPMLVGLALKSVFSLGSAVWVPAFYIRTFGWSPTQIGLVQGALYLTAAPLGAMFGAWLAERLARRGRADANMRVAFYATILATPLAIIFPLMPSAPLAFAFGAAQLFVSFWVFGPQNAALQLITPNRMRGQVTAVFLFVINVVGFAMGPIFVALMTDNIFGEAGLRYSLAVAAAIIGPIAALVIGSGLKAYGGALERSRSWA